MYNLMWNNLIFANVIMFQFGARYGYIFIRQKLYNSKSLKKEIAVKFWI